MTFLTAKLEQGLHSDQLITGEEWKSSSQDHAHTHNAARIASDDADQQPRDFAELWDEVLPTPHQSQLPPTQNKFHVGNGDDGKHYWLTPPDLYERLNARFSFTFDPCPFPKPDDFDGLTCEWGTSNYVNPPFGSIIHEGRKKGPTAWARKAIAEAEKGRRTVLVYPIDKWVLMLLAAGAKVENLGDVRWLATEDGSQGKGTGRHIAAFILDPAPVGSAPLTNEAAPAAHAAQVERDKSREDQ